MDSPFNKEPSLQDARLYPKLFEALREAGFIEHIILVQHHDRSRTLYELASDKSIRVIAESAIPQ